MSVNGSFSVERSSRYYHWHQAWPCCGRRRLFVLDATALHRFAAGNHIVDGSVLIERIQFGQRIVGQPLDAVRLKICFAQEARQFCWCDELGVVMGTPGQHTQQILGTDNGKQIRFQITIER